MDIDSLHSFTALVNLFMVSATAKWAFMSFIFVPVLASMGISPDMTQCAFRIGDSATNAITPFMFYMPLVLTYMQQYDRQSTYGSLLKYTWRYSLVILLAWTALFVLWYISGLPLDCNVITNEQPAFDNPGNGFQFLFQIRNNVAEMNVKNEITAFGNTGPSFPSARRRLIFEAPNKRISFSTWERACGNTSTGMGYLLPVC